MPFYFQVQFMNVRTVTAIQTQGRNVSAERWVKTYRAEYSLDCSTFVSLLDLDGSNRVHSLMTVFHTASHKLGKPNLFDFNF